MPKQSLDSILEGFNPGMFSRGAGLDGGTVTIWLDDDYKTKYARIQAATRKRFIINLRDIVKAAIDAAEERLSPPISENKL